MSEKISIGSKPQLRWLAVDSIRVDHNYQRGIKRNRVNKIMRNFDWSLFGALLVAEKPDGSYWVYDGQHRLEAAKLHPKIDEIPVQISKFDNVRGEAAAFLGVNVNRSAVTTVERYWAGLEAGDPDMMAVCAVLDEAGCEVVGVAGEKALNKTSAVMAISRSIKINGEAALVKALTTIRSSWPTQHGALKGVIINALASLYRHNKIGINQQIMVDVLSDVSHKKLTADAEVLRDISGGSAEKNIKQVLISKYNKAKGSQKYKNSGAGAR